jgi:hypothetical protein
MELLHPGSGLGGLLRAASNWQRISVDITPGHATNSLSPLRALGAAIDRDPYNSLKTIFSHDEVQEMLSSGWGAVSYRLNTELGAQAWHWNPKGMWSDPSGKGYFVGASDSSGSIARSFGYFLDHNGMSQSFLGYSTLDDGDLSTYWKTIRTSRIISRTRVTYCILSGSWLTWAVESRSMPSKLHGPVPMQ